jgi:hypothetical protein
MTVKRPALTRLKMPVSMVAAKRLRCRATSRAVANSSPKSTMVMAVSISGAPRATGSSGAGGGTVQSRSGTFSMRTPFENAALASECVETALEIHRNATSTKSFTATSGSAKNMSPKSSAPAPALSVRPEPWQRV